MCVWLPPVWAAMARPTISPVAPMVPTAVIQRRTRRVIAISFTRCVPCSGIIGCSKPRRRRMGIASPGPRCLQPATYGDGALAIIPLLEHPRRGRTPATAASGGLRCSLLAFELHSGEVPWLKKLC